MSQIFTSPTTSNQPAKLPGLLERPEGAVHEALTLKSDFSNRPLWVCPDGRIYFEAFHEILYSPVSEFLISVADPVCRPQFVHEFQITLFSLYAAVSLGMTADEILQSLDRFSKNVIDPGLVNYIKTVGGRMGKVRIILRRGRYWIESSERALLEELSASERIARARLSGILLRGPQTSAVKKISQEIYAFEIDGRFFEDVKETAYRMSPPLPLLEEYDFRHELAPSSLGEGEPSGPSSSSSSVGSAEARVPPVTPMLKISFRSSTAVRSYQEKSLNRMFAGGRARSGLIVLPCGAGKTLVGITACCTIKQRCLVLTTTAVAVDQWKRSFELFCAIDPADVITLTSDNKQRIPTDRAIVLISTYSMFSVTYGRMSRASRAVIDAVREVEWGLLVVDEVQVMPAKTFRTVATTVRAHCKLGLTATLVREDNLIEDLNYLIGPKLYEAHWLELQEAGFIAKVQCIEVWCAMTREFRSAYQAAGQQHHVRRAVYTCNPRKLMACEYLVNEHERRGDKIIVFCDNIMLMKDMAQRLRKAFICGSVSMQERMACIRCFQHSNRINTIFLSKVGDNAIDIPNANVVIQISSHYGSRRQEAQRLGRILRPKPCRDDEGFNAYFYTLVTRDTPERLYADQRQKFLVDQGYAYKILADFDDRVADASASGRQKFVYEGVDAQKEILAMCLTGFDDASDD